MYMNSFNDEVCEYSSSTYYEGFATGSNVKGFDVKGCEKMCQDSCDKKTFTEADGKACYKQCPELCVPPKKSSTTHSCEWNETRQCLSSSRSDECYEVSLLKDNRCAVFGKRANAINDIARGFTNL